MTSDGDAEPPPPYPDAIDHMYWVRVPILSPPQQPSSSSPSPTSNLISSLVTNATVSPNDESNARQPQHQHQRQERHIWWPALVYSRHDDFMGALRRHKKLRHWIFREKKVTFASQFVVGGVGAIGGGKNGEVRVARLLGDVTPTGTHTYPIPWGPNDGNDDHDGGGGVTAGKGGNVGDEEGVRRVRDYYEWYDKFEETYRSNPYWLRARDVADCIIFREGEKEEEEQRVVVGQLPQKEQQQQQQKSFGIGTLGVEAAGLGGAALGGGIGSGAAATENSKATAVFLSTDDEQEGDASVLTSTSSSSTSMPPLPDAVKGGMGGESGTAKTPEPAPSKRRSIVNSPSVAGITAFATGVGSAVSYVCEASLSPVRGNGTTSRIEVSQFHGRKGKHKEASEKVGMENVGSRKTSATTVTSHYSAISTRPLTPSPQWESKNSSNVGDEKDDDEGDGRTKPEATSTAVVPLPPSPFFAAPSSSSSSSSTSSVSSYFTAPRSIVDVSIRPNMNWNDLEKNLFKGGWGYIKKPSLSSSSSSSPPTPTSSIFYVSPKFKPTYFRKGYKGRGRTSRKSVGQLEEEGARRNVDYFDKKELQVYCRVRYGWVGEREEEKMKQREDKLGQVIRPDMEWKDVEAALYTYGWGYIRGSGTIYCYYVSPPFKGKKKTEMFIEGRKGMDYFESLDELKAYCKRTYGWIGEKEFARDESAGGSDVIRLPTSTTGGGGASRAQGTVATLASNRQKKMLHNKRRKRQIDVPPATAKCGTPTRNDYRKLIRPEMDWKDVMMTLKHNFKWGYVSGDRFVSYFYLVPEFVGKSKGQIMKEGVRKRDYFDEDELKDYCREMFGWDGGVSNSGGSVMSAETPRRKRGSVGVGMCDEKTRKKKKKNGPKCSTPLTEKHQYPSSSLDRPMFLNVATMARESVDSELSNTSNTSFLSPEREEVLVLDGDASCEDGAEEDDNDSGSASPRSNLEPSIIVAKNERRKDVVAMEETFAPEAAEVAAASPTRDPVGAPRDEDEFCGASQFDREPVVCAPAQGKTEEAAEYTRKVGSTEAEVGAKERNGDVAEKEAEGGQTLLTSEQASSDDEDDDRHCLSHIDAWNILLKTFKFRYKKNLFCLPGHGPGEDNSIEGVHYFERLELLRMHLCAYGLPNGDLADRLSRGHRNALDRWIRDAIVKDLSPESIAVQDSGTRYNDWKEAWRLLQTLGYKWTSGGGYKLPGSGRNGIEGKDCFVKWKDFEAHLARFGIVGSEHVDAMELRRLEKYLAGCKHVNVFERIDPTPEDATKTTLHSKPVTNVMCSELSKCPYTNAGAQIVQLKCSSVEVSKSASDGACTLVNAEAFEDACESSPNPNYSADGHDNIVPRVNSGVDNLKANADLVKSSLHPITSVAQSSIAVARTIATENISFKSGASMNEGAMATSNLVPREKDREGEKIGDTVTQNHDRTDGKSIEGEGVAKKCTQENFDHLLGGEGFNLPMNTSECSVTSILMEASETRDNIGPQMDSGQPTIGPVCSTPPILFSHPTRRIYAKSASSPESHSSTISKEKYETMFTQPHEKSLGADGASEGSEGDELGDCGNNDSVTSPFKLGGTERSRDSIDSLLNGLGAPNISSSTNEYLLDNDEDEAESVADPTPDINYRNTLSNSGSSDSTKRVEQAEKLAPSPAHIAKIHGIGPDDNSSSYSNLLEEPGASVGRAGIGSDKQVHQKSTQNRVECPARGNNELESFHCVDTQRPKDGHTCSIESSKETKKAIVTGANEQGTPVHLNPTRSIESSKEAEGSRDFWTPTKEAIAANKRLALRIIAGTNEQGTPVQSDDPWNVVYAKLLDSGWKYSKGCGLVAYNYILPGGKYPGGKPGEDYVTSEEDLKEWTKRNLGWEGDAQRHDLNGGESGERRKRRFGKIVEPAVAKDQKSVGRNKSNQDHQALVSTNKEGEAEKSTKRQGPQSDDRARKKAKQVPRVHESKTKGSSHDLPLESARSRLDRCIKRLHPSFSANGLAFSPSVTSRMNQVKRFLENFIQTYNDASQKGSSIQTKTTFSLYCCGGPGTGKTCTVLHCVTEQEKKAKKKAGNLCTPLFKYINAAHVPSSECVYRQIAECVEASRESSTPQEIKKMLSQGISNKWERSKPSVVVILDEVDSLLSDARKTDAPQNDGERLLQTLLGWASDPNCAFAFIGLSNSVDDKPARRLGLLGKIANTIVFPTYTEDELLAILRHRLVDGVIADPALRLVSRKVAATTGDARKVLDLTSKAVANCQSMLAMEGKLDGTTAGECPLVNFPHVMKAIRADSTGVHAARIASLPQAAKIILCVAMALSQVSPAWKVFRLGTLKMYCTEASKHGLIENLSIDHLYDLIQQLSDAGLLHTGSGNVTAGGDDLCHQFDFDIYDIPLRLGVQLDDVEIAMEEHLLSQPFYRKLVKHVRERE